MLGRYDRAMRARWPVGRLTLLQQAIAAIKRNNGTLFYVPQNALGDGAPNLLSAPEFAGGLTDAPVRAGLVTLSSMSGYDNAINFGHDGSTLSYALKTPSHTNGLSYTLTVIVEMTDGLEPTFASTSMNSALNTFALVLFNITSNPLTYIVKSLGGAVYSVSATTVSSGSVQQAGVYKYATNNNRTFKVTGYKLELGSTATAYTPQSVLRTRGVFIDSAGVSPVANIAGVIGRMTDRTGGSAVATQATTANKPTVQINAQGRYVMRFDGSNDSLTTNITTGNEGWICAGVTFGGPVGNFETVFANGAGSPTLRGVWLVRTAADFIRMGVGNGTALTMPYIAVLSGIPQVVEGGWTSTTVTVGLNGTTSSLARTGNATPAPYASLIGAYVPTVHSLNGPMTAQVICPVLPSAADRAIIRKWIGSLQGQTL